ncbi:MAG: 3-deoxy-manno-octulosonate cytidylyltransferase [Phycisphaerae bacterium]|nr:3-deoxy-manno-octulosonate cytidylyltransferase [Phycisphaerae bacterium]
MSVVVIIPARYASSRLPGKPLLCETGKPLIQHVVEAVSPSARVDSVVVATDDVRIADAVEAFGGRAVMTRDDHISGTDRLAEAAELLELADNDIVINVQGDEPDFKPQIIDELLDVIETTDAPMGTLCTPLAPELADDPNRVKVVFDGADRAMYFSRAKIPFDRDGAASYFLHLGIYAYRVGFLKKFSQLSPTPTEQSEKLEQLRAIEHGYAIAIKSVDYDGNGIDTPGDYAAFVARVGKSD